MLGAHRDVVLEQSAGLGAAVEATAHLPLPGLEAAVNRAGTDGLELAIHGRRDAGVAAGPGEPQREQGFQAGGPRVAGGVPDGGEHLERLVRVVPGPAPRLRWAEQARSMAEQGDSVFSMIPSGRAELCEELRLCPARKVEVAQPNGMGVLASRRRGHRGLRGHGMADRVR